MIICITKIHVHVYEINNACTDTYTCTMCMHAHVNVHVPYIPLKYNPCLYLQLNLNCYSWLGGWHPWHYFMSSADNVGASSRQKLSAELPV